MTKHFHFLFLISGLCCACGALDSGNKTKKNQEIFNVNPLDKDYIMFLKAQEKEVKDDYEILSQLVETWRFDEKQTTCPQLAKEAFARTAVIELIDRIKLLDFDRIASFRTEWEEIRTEYQINETINENLYSRVKNFEADLGRQLLINDILNAYLKHKLDLAQSCSMVLKSYDFYPVALNYQHHIKKGEIFSADFGLGTHSTIINPQNWTFKLGKITIADTIIRAPNPAKGEKEMEFVIQKMNPVTGKRIEGTSNIKYIVLASAKGGNIAEARKSDKTAFIQTLAEHKKKQNQLWTELTPLFLPLLEEDCKSDAKAKYRFLVSFAKKVHALTQEMIELHQKEGILATFDLAKKMDGTLSLLIRDYGESLDLTGIECDNYINKYSWSNGIDDGEEWELYWQERGKKEDLNTYFKNMLLKHQVTLLNLTHQLVLVKLVSPNQLGTECILSKNIQEGTSFYFRLNPIEYTSQLDLDYTDCTINGKRQNMNEEGLIPYETIANEVGTQTVEVKMTITNPLTKQEYSSQRVFTYEVVE